MMDDVDGKDHLRQVKKYYDHNTERFLMWGKDDSSFNLHGALWPPEVNSLAAAMHYSDELVAREIERCPYPVDRVLDLGCGVGGSIFYLVRRLSRVRSFTGISLSPLQINSARQRIPEAQKNRIQFEEGCFLQLPTDRFWADFSYSIWKPLNRGAGCVEFTGRSSGFEKEKASACNRRLIGLGAYRFNWSLRKQLRLESLNWVNSQCVM